MKQADLVLPPRARITHMPLLMKELFKSSSVEPLWKQLEQYSHAYNYKGHRALNKPTRRLARLTAGQPSQMLILWERLWNFLEVVNLWAWLLPVTLQVRPSLSSVYSASHEHRKEPRMLTQCWLQKPRLSHSFTSSQVLESLASWYPDGHTHVAPKGPCMHWWVQPPLECMQLSWSRIKSHRREGGQTFWLFWLTLKQSHARFNELLRSTFSWIICLLLIVWDCYPLKLNSTTTLQYLVLWENTADIKKLNHPWWSIQMLSLGFANLTRNGTIGLKGVTEKARSGEDINWLTHHHSLLSGPTWQ